jgi:hypothetical protein
MEILSQFVNAEIVAAILVIIEFLKPYIADAIESKIIPLIDVGLGIIISILFNGGVLPIAIHPVISIQTVIIGIASGMVAAAGYSVGMKMVGRIGTFKEEVK